LLKKSNNGAFLPRAREIHPSSRSCRRPVGTIPIINPRGISMSLEVAAGESRSALMKKFLLSVAFTVLLVGFVVAEEFTLQITSIESDGTVKGNKVAIAKKAGGGGAKGGFGKAEEVTVKLAKNVTVHKGKFNMEAKGFAADGDDLKLTGLKAAFEQAQNGNVLVAGKALTSKDSLELTVHDGKPAAKLNGKEVPFTDVTVRGKTGLTARVTTNDDGVGTSVILVGGGAGGFGGFGGFGGKAKAKTE
jgi:hypothetical protein